MFKYNIIIIAFGLLLVASDGYGQKATEIYVPVGKSPGISGELSIIGTMGHVEISALTLAVKDSVKSQDIKLDDKTKIWLDNSKLKIKSMYGTPADLREGVLVEVMLRKTGSGTVAEWIKVQRQEIKSD